MNRGCFIKRRLARLFFTTVVLFVGAQSYGVEHDLSDTPLFTLAGVDPNIVLTMDDSGSMAWSFMPSSIDDKPFTKRAKSPAFNKIYYDRKVVYDPPVDDKGVSLGNSKFTEAWDDGFNQAGCKVNLSTKFAPTWGGNKRDHCTDEGDDASRYPLFSGDEEPAYYYIFDNSVVAGVCDGTIDDDGCYTKVVVSDSSGQGETVDERDNFANWYSYYRKRVYVTKTAATLSFARFNANIRAGYQQINLVAPLPVRTFSGNDRKAFFNSLMNLEAGGGTPLRKAM